MPTVSGRPSSGASVGVLVNLLQLTRIHVTLLITSTDECFTFGL
jgi:hypothetical protein